MSAGPQSFLQCKTILALNLTLALWFLSSCFPKGKRNQRGRGFWQKQNPPILLQLYFYLGLTRTDLVLFVGRLSVSLLRGCLWVACLLKQPPSGESFSPALIHDGQRKWDWVVTSLSYTFSIHPISNIALLILCRRSTTCKSAVCTTGLLSSTTSPLNTRTD